MKDPSHSVKKETIPRLELLAALTLPRLMKSVHDSLDGVQKIDEIVCWVDSQIVLWRIKGKGRWYKQFVQNRVTYWRYCPTASNPADIASRGAKCSELSPNDRWWNGPAFLAERRDRWPADVTCTNLDFSVVGEIKEDEARLEVCNAFVVAAKRPEVRLASVIDCEKFSKSPRLFLAS